MRTDFRGTDGVFRGGQVNLVLLGCIAFFDPPKESAARALETLAKMGVTTKTLTGDNVEAVT